MSSSGKGKKKVNRPGPKKNLGQNQTPLYEGAYGNPRVVHVLLSLMGKKCQATVRNGNTYEGLFHTYSPKMDVALNVVHKCNKSPDQSASTNGSNDRFESDFPKEEELIQQMVFRSENLVSMKFEDVDLDFATQDINETNGETVRDQRSSKSGEKKLEPWNGGGDSLGADPLTIGGLESSSLDGTNGWDANEMFRANEEKYGVKSDYDSSLSSYTMPLDLQDEDSERVARATRIAKEIESGSDHKQRTDLELDDGTTEEDKFSAVVREREFRKDGRGPRDMRDRDNEHGGYRDKDRPWGDRDRDHPISPQGCRNNKHDNFDRNRNRGRGRDPWSRGNQHGYAGQNMGPSRSMGMGGPQGGGGRNQSGMSQMDGPSGPREQGKFRNAPSSQLPPRFTKSGSGGYSRDEERMRHQNDNSAMHSSYSAPKGQRQPRRPNNGRWGPSSPSGEYQHHSPTQMHQDPAVISTGPSGAPALSRTSSSSSNASAPVQNHRKHLSTSSQEEQQPQLPSQHHHHQHMRQHQSSSPPTGGPMISNNQQTQQRPQQIPPPLPTPQQQEGSPAHTWASIASRNPKPQIVAVPSDMAQAHIGQGGSPGLQQQSPGTNKVTPIVMQPNQTFSWSPSPSNVSCRPGMGQQMQANMTSPRVHPGPMTARQVMGRVPPQPQAGVVTSPPQSQPGVVTSPPQQMHPQHPLQAQQSPRMAQPAMKSPAVEPVKPQTEKAEEVKPQKKAMEPSAIQTTPSGGAKSRNEGIEVKELREFNQNFRLSTDVNKEQPSVQPAQPPTKVQQRQTQNTQPSQRQPYPNPMTQQPGYQQQPAQAAPQQQTYAASMSHQEHNNHVLHQMVPSVAQIPANQAVVQQPKQIPGMVMHHPQQMSHQMTQQIPMPSPSIQHFAAQSPQQSPVQVSPRPMESPIVMGSRTPVIPQKTITSPKAEMPNYPPSNVHVVTGPPVSQANPPAVISVSAATLSPISPSQYQQVTANTSVNQHQRQSPTPGQAAPPSSTPSVETAGSVPSSTPTASVTSPTSAAGKPLNPEALEFKPRSTPSKPPAIATRATTPLQQQSYVYQPQGIGGMGPQTPILYSTGAPIDMQTQMSQMYPHPQFQQQFNLGQQLVVQPIPGQQFATFDHQGQMYPAPAPQQIMAQNTTMAAIPSTPQQHMPQYQPDQSPGTVYVPVAPQQANFMQQQARPHSAHTPTQATHVTAASPAGQSTQQAPQPAGHPAPAMVPTHGAQQQMWMPTMVVQAGQIPQHPQHVNQPPQMTPQFINAVQGAPLPSTVAMTQNVSQPKGQQQSIQYMARPYAQ